MDRRTDPIRLPGPDRHVISASGELRRPRSARQRCGTSKARRRSGRQRTAPHRPAAGRIDRQQAKNSRRPSANRAGVRTSAGRLGVPSGSRPTRRRPGIHWLVRPIRPLPVLRRSVASAQLRRKLEPPRSVGRAPGVGGTLRMGSAAHRRVESPTPSRRHVDHDGRMGPSQRMVVERRRRPAKLAVVSAGGPFSFPYSSS